VYKLPQAPGEEEAMDMSGARGTENGSARAVYLAFDLGNREWKLGFTTGLGQTPRLCTIGA
jgi:hypothetical protein